MSMARFIEDNQDEILDEWESFAASLTPAAEGLTAKELRNLAYAIIRSVVEDMQIEQSERERHQKSIRSLEADRTDIGHQARGHAAERLTEGFTLNQLIAEYRALRANVIRQWRRQLEDVGDYELEELTRFNEAIDESLSEAVGWYNSRIEDARDLLNGVLAHDMRNPLGSAMTSAEVLLHDESLSPQNTRAAVRIRNSCKRLSKMIGDLLDFTRTRLGTGLPIATTEGDLGEEVREVVEELRNFHPDSTIHCHVDGDLTGSWDLARIEQLLSNLISNALEHGEFGSPVNVHALSADGELHVTIHNEGAIPEEEQRVIFDPLRRAVAQGMDDRSRHGLGLGLYIARQIAEAHDGAIDVMSSGESGTTFTVRLPRERKSGSATAGMT